VVVILSPRDLLTHAPVLLNEVVEYLAVQPGGRYVDCTTGAGGHGRAVLEAASPGGVLLGLDADPVAISVASQNLSSFGDSVQLVESNFRDLKRVCRSHNFIPVHGILLDLGISSMQLADERGFSFQVEAPLDMRFNPGQALTADDIVNDYAEQDLADVIWRFGEEPSSRRIARAIVRARRVGTTTELAAIIARTAGGRRRSTPRRAPSRRFVSPSTTSWRAARRTGQPSKSWATAAVGGYRTPFARRPHGQTVPSAESRDCICPPNNPCICGHRATLRIITRHGDTFARGDRPEPRSRSARSAPRKSCRRHAK
jgi:16S rRNA (cytosine1402-N4)-methyltransferase